MGVLVMSEVFKMSNSENESGDLIDGPSREEWVELERLGWWLIHRARGGRS